MGTNVLVISFFIFFKYRNGSALLSAILHMTFESVQKDCDEYCFFLLLAKYLLLFFTKWNKGWCTIL